MLMYQLKVIILDFFLFVNENFLIIFKQPLSSTQRRSNVNITKRIEKLCSAKNITIAELERKLDFGNGTIRRWEKSFPSVDKLAKVADFFNVGITFLYSGEEEKGGDIAARKFNELSTEEREAVENLIDFYIERKKKNGV